MRTGDAVIPATLDKLALDSADRARVRAAMKSLDAKYALFAKAARESGLADIIEQLLGRLLNAYPQLPAVQGKRILDIACGSNTSRAPKVMHVNGPLGRRAIHQADTKRFTALFEPWFCRILLELGAQPVGVDRGELESESFEHYLADLGEIGALDFLPSRSFDALQDSRLFGSPEFTAQFPHKAERLKVAQELIRQEQRLLKPWGITIHSDARDFVQRESAPG